MPGKKKAPKRYATHVTAPDGQRIYITGKTKEEFDRKVAETRMALDAGVNIADTTTFSEYAKLWLKTYKAPPKLRPNSYATLVGTLERHVLPSLGPFPLKEVKPMQIQLFMQSLSGKSRSTQNKCIQIVRSIFRTAEDNGLILKSPVRSDVKPVGAPRVQSPDALTNDQARRLLQAVQGTGAYLFCLVALTTGMRRGEILGLMWQDIDFDADEIHVTHNKAFPEGVSDVPVTELLKSDAARRTLPVPPLLRKVLLEERARSASPYVLSTRDGRSMTKSSFQSMWRSVTVRTVSEDRPLGSPIQGSKYGKASVSLDFTCHPHQLRHTYITQLFEAGNDLKQVQYLAGHSTPDMTLRVYTHYRQSARKQETVDTVTRATDYLSGASVSRSTGTEGPAPSPKVVQFRRK